MSSKPPMFLVCPHCKVELHEGNRCPCCKRVVTPLRSAVRNEFYEDRLPVCEYCCKPVDQHSLFCSRPKKRLAWRAV